jgi:hypothetical protein
MAKFSWKISWKKFWEITSIFHSKIPRNFPWKMDFPWKKCTRNWPLVSLR